MTEYKKLIDLLYKDLGHPNSAIVDFNSVKGAHSTLNKYVAIVDKVELEKLDEVENLFLWFPITCDDICFSKWSEIMYGNVPIIRFPCKAKNIYLVDTVCNTVQNFVRKIPLIKGMTLDSMIYPDGEIKNFTVIKWVKSE